MNTDETVISLLSKQQHAKELAERLPMQYRDVLELVLSGWSDKAIEAYSAITFNASEYRWVGSFGKTDVFRLG
jgi:lipopolysaccharide biosynthesis regulator YciM